MTAQNNGEPEGTASNGETTSQNQLSSCLPSKIVSIFEFLSFNPNIVFKSQQIDDPELERNEKVRIAQSLYLDNRQKFLERFGGYFEKQHLENFASLALSNAASPLNEHENHEEMLEMLANFTLRLKTRSKDIKNRRFAALQKLVKDGEYFSEREMMKRAPELYQEMIGQYLTEAEKKDRDSYDVKNTTFSGILIHTMEQEKMKEILKKADENNTRRIDHPLLEDEDTTTQSSLALGAKETQVEKAESTRTVDQQMVEEEEDSDDSNAGPPRTLPIRNDYSDEIPQTCRTQWGNFDNEQKACSISAPKKMDVDGNQTAARPGGSKKTKPKLITGPERDLLRREFVGIMHERFLIGDDKDFDYSGVDDNSEYDDLKQLNQDREDAYFDESSEDGTEEVSSTHSPSLESEDELDIYMRHLSNHPSLQKT